MKRNHYHCTEGLPVVVALTEVKGNQEAKFSAILWALQVQEKPINGN